jgi:hypothetical protein
MIRELSTGLQDYGLIGPFEPAIEGRTLAFADATSALDFLERLAEDPFNAAALRDLLTETDGSCVPSALEDHEVIELLARRLAGGSVRVIERARPDLGGVGAIAEAEEPSRAEAPARSEVLSLEFRFRTRSGHAIHDPEGFELVHPDGRVEPGRLTEGSWVREGVAPGPYRMRFRHLRGASWSRASVHADEDVELRVVAGNCPDGAEVTFRIFETYQSTATEPVAELAGAVADEEARATWRYEQELGAPPACELFFEASIGPKRARSDAIAVIDHPLEDLRGVQQRLKELGYDCGPTDGVMGPRTERAVRAFQEDHPPLVVDGIPGRLTRRELAPR